MKKILLKAFMLLCLILWGGVSSAWADSWTRCTEVSDLTSGGTFIIGYEATANSGKIIPMKNTGGTATTSTAGYMASGSEIDMATVTTTTDYEFSIVASTSVTGAICIKCGDNFIGNTDTKNNCKLFAEEANTTAYGVTVGTNDVFTLKIAANETYHTLQYNTGSPRFAVYGGAQKNLVFYKKTTSGGGTTPTTYTVTIANNIANGTVTADKTSAAEGATVTLTATPSTGYEFGSWNVTNASTSTAITVTNNKFTMPAANVNVGATFTAIPVFANLEELVAADLATGSNVTVSFENVPIKAFQTVSSTRKGVYFDIQKGGKDIEIYFNSEIPAAWAVEGTLSGTLTNCPWKLYSGTWELAPASGWAWTNLTYKAPAQKTITALEVSGTPTKTTYNVGDVFETAGLVVTATYSDDTQAPITEGFEWEIDYGQDNTALVADATSVDVMAYIGDEVMSEVYTVNGITVTVPVTLTSIAVSGNPTKTEYYAGDAFEPAGLVVTGTYSDSHKEVINEGIDWTIDPETLTLETTSVDVLASVGSVVSDVFTVEGLTVTKPDFETVTYNFSSFVSGTSVELTDLDGFVITLKGNGGTNPAWSSNQARVYAKGSLSVKANNATIKSIEYEYTVNANSRGVTPTIDGVEGTTTAGTWDAENKTWTGADEEVTFSTSGTAGNVGFTKLVIKYVESDMILTSLEWSEDAAEVTIGADDNVFPTLTTTPVDLAGVTYGSSNTAVATIAADGTITLVKAGETTITASYAGDAEHKPATPDSYTLTVNKAPFVPTPVAEGYETVDFAALYSSETNNATVEDYEGISFALTFAKPQSSTTPTKYYDNGKAVRAYEGNTITIKAAENIQNVDIAWVRNYVDDAVSITGLGTETAVVTFSKTCRFTAISVDYRFATIAITSACTDGEKCYSTYSNAASWVVPENLTVSEIGVSDNKLQVVSYKTGDVVPANTGVMVSAAEGGNYTVALTTNAGTHPADAANCLRPSGDDGITADAMAAADDNCTFYRLTMHNGETIGFWWGAAEGAAFTLAANKAYLAVPKSNSEGARTGLWFSDNEEALEAVEMNAATTIYTLEGVKVNELQKGLNIVNGKKVMVK